jgi:hypothetical protein
VLKVQWATPDDGQRRFQAKSGWNFSSILTLLGSGRKLLMMGREDYRKM